MFSVAENEWDGDQLRGSYRRDREFIASAGDGDQLGGGGKR